MKVSKKRDGVIQKNCCPKRYTPCSENITYVFFVPGIMFQFLWGIQKIQYGIARQVATSEVPVKPQRHFENMCSFALRTLPD